MIPTYNHSNKGIITKTMAFQSSGYLSVRLSHLTISVKVSYKLGGGEERERARTHTHKV